MSAPPKCQDCGKWVIGPGHEDECPAPSECRCPPNAVKYCPVCGGAGEFRHDPCGPSTRRDGQARSFSADSKAARRKLRLRTCRTLCIKMKEERNRAEADGKASFDLSVECRARAVKAEADLTACRDALRELRAWLDSNTTYYNVDADWPVEGPNIPTLAQVTNRIWYHATDDVTNYPFSAVVDAARAAELELRRDVISDVQNKQLRHADAEVARLIHDGVAYQGALGYPVPGHHDGTLSNGATPTCRVCAFNSRSARDAEADNAKLRERVKELEADRDSWQAQADDRVDDVLEQEQRAIKADAEIAKLRERVAELRYG